MIIKCKPIWGYLNLIQMYGKVLKDLPLKNSALFGLVPYNGSLLNGGDMQLQTPEMFTFARRSDFLVGGVGVFSGANLQLVLGRFTWMSQEVSKRLE